MDKKLYVITVISNPVRYRSRYDLYNKFAKHVEDSGAILITAEMAYGDRDFAITEPGNPYHLQLRSRHELWHKENMMNLALARLPADAEYIAWIDADITFSRPDWVSETVELLQHYDVIQMFEYATDLGPNFEPLKTHKSFVSQWCESESGLDRNQEYHAWHPGYAWAARREAIDRLGGFFDEAILGSGDRHMACSLIGDVSASFYPDMDNCCPELKSHLLAYQHRANKYINRNIGFMPGTILHHWHGKKKDRGYGDRWKNLTDNKFNPVTDIYRDTQGLYQLTDEKPRLRDGIRRYFRSRNEDDISLG